ncbi:MAG: phosphotransferase [Lacisediminihabitans sp.]
MSAPDTTALNVAFADSRLLDQVAVWLPTQRWYAGKGRTPQLRLSGRFTLTDPAGVAGIHILLVMDESGQPVLYQLPVTVYRSPVIGFESSLVAILDGDYPLYFYDGPHDQTFTGALLRLILDGETLSGEPTAAVDTDSAQAPVVHGHPSLAPQHFDITSSRVFGGEQSNSSIIYSLADAAGTPLRPAICKIFRTLQHGDNPDVMLLDALGAAGSRVVPQSLGYLGGRWADSRRTDGFASGQLAFAQEFLPDVEDAWRLALCAAEEGSDFSSAARALGEATAEVHETLARALGTTSCTLDDVTATMASMQSRLALAIAEVPGLAELRTVIETVYARAAASPWPAMQRIHGDLHLGQVLSVPSRGWVLLDFEGEPLRPMAERNTPDLPLRDIAGMLRSFDYVAGAYALAHPELTATEWASNCRTAFLGGYSARTEHDLVSNRVLLDAFEIDKAVYEAVYEARNRPEWLPIPVAAIARLAAQAAAN